MKIIDKDKWSITNGDVSYYLDNWTLEQSIGESPSIQATIGTTATAICSNNTITTTGWSYDYNSTGIQTYPYSNDYLVYNNGTWDYESTIKQIVDEKLKEKENENKMTNNFGPYSNNNLRLSPFGIAIKNKSGKWVSYNKETNRLMDVDIFNITIDTSKIFYRIPKPLSEIKPGNLIIHNEELVFVERIDDYSRLTVINPSLGTEMTILPATSPFGFDYVETIISLADYFPEADDENPWGNLLPFMMMGKDNSAIAMIMAMGGDMREIDPLMLLAASGDNSFLMMQLMMHSQKRNKEKEYPEPFRKSQEKRKRNNLKDDIDE